MGHLLVSNTVCGGTLYPGSPCCGTPFVAEVVTDCMLRQSLVTVPEYRQKKKMEAVSGETWPTVALRSDGLHIVALQSV